MRLAKDWRARPIPFHCQEGYSIESMMLLKEKQDPWEAAAWVVSLLHHRLSKKLNVSQFPHLKNENNPPLEDHCKDHMEKTHAST